MLKFVKRHPAWTVFLAIILCIFSCWLALELNQSFESMQKQHNAYTYLMNDSGIASWNTEEKWTEGCETLARILTCSNDNGSVTSWIDYRNLYFIDRRSGEFLEIVQEIVDVKWSNPNREKIVEEFLGLEFNRYIGGKPYQLLYQRKGYWIDSDTATLRNLLEL